MSKTKIDWATDVENPVFGCLNGCPWCYARRMAARVAAMTAAASGKPVCENCRDFVPHLHPERLPNLRKGRNLRIFVGSMCDMWSPGVEQEWRDQVFAACSNPANTYLFLTKRPKHVSRTDVRGMLYGSANLWLGCTATDDAELSQRFHSIRWEGLPNFVSIEPMMGPLRRDTLEWTVGRHGDWAIIGPGTGAASGRTERAWVEQAIADLRALGVPVWLKESCFDLWPDMERVQELPEGMPR